MSNFFTGWFQINIINNYKIFRRSFVINQKWFDKLYLKHYTKDIESKFNLDLFVDQDMGRATNLLKEIRFETRQISQYKNELRILADCLNQFKTEFQELKEFLIKEKIGINISSLQYKQLELLSQKISCIKQQIEEQNLILTNGIDSSENSLSKISFDYEYGHGFEFKRIEEYTEDLKFLNKIPSSEYPVAIVFRRQSEILNQIRTLNSLDSDFFNRIKIIHGKAGMGKSNISAFLTSTLKQENHPIVFIKAKSFSGSPDEFNRILMEQLLVPNNYSIEEVISKIDDHGKSLNKRTVLIFDGLNETTYANEGFSEIWKKNLDSFIELLSNFKYIYCIITLRTSYISRVWSNNQIPYSNFELKGFNEINLETVVEKYFINYMISYEKLNTGDFFYFKTPLLIDLYCQMLNPNKDVEIEAVLGLNGFKDVFERYVTKLAENVRNKLTLGTVDQIKDGIDRCSTAMLENLEANVPIMKFYSLMQNENVVKVGGTIGDEILSEYLIYLDENHNNRDVVIHTQQEVGGYLLAKKLINDFGTVDEVIKTEFFREKIVGTTDPLHQLKDDILKFLIIESDENSDIFDQYIEDPTVKKFTLITLETEKINSKTLKLSSKISGTLRTKDEVNEILNGFYSTFFDEDSPLNFNFIKAQLISIDNNVFEYTWTKLIYDNYYEIDELISKINDEEIVIEEVASKDLIVDFLIWTLETTIRELRDKIYLILLEYFKQNPNQIFAYIFEYAKYNKPYIYERLVSVCYAICLINQNDEEFINNFLKENINNLYELQFGKNPKSPVYNYIVIDCIKHIVDFAIFKKIYSIQKDEEDDFNNYRFQLNSWFEITEDDKRKVESITAKWTLDDNPDPLRGDFVHYTIPRLEERDNKSRFINTANIYKQIINLGYISEVENLSNVELKFKQGESHYGFKGKIDRLGKKYSWISFFDYAGYLLNQNKLNVWKDNDSEYGKYYSRLSDVEIEITNPNPIILNEKLTNIDLYEHKSSHQDWVYKTMYNEILDLFEQNEFTMLSGFINQRENESYDSRSFLLINSFFVKKQTLSGNINKVLNRNYDWRDDVIANNSTLTKVYFGELYWADNIPKIVSNYKDLPISEEEDYEHIVHPFDPIHFPAEYDIDDIGKSIIVRKEKRVSFEYEPTLIEYLWESSSKTIPSISSVIPNFNIGKQLDLRANTDDLLILDNLNNLAHKTYRFEENFYEQDFEYFRTDLLKEYMEKNEYILMYQVKQHTFDRISGDGSGDFRGMQFFASQL